MSKPNPTRTIIKALEDFEEVVRKRAIATGNDKLIADTLYIQTKSKLLSLITTLLMKQR